MRSLSAAVTRKSAVTAAARHIHKHTHAATRLSSSPLVLLITTLSITTCCPTLVRGRIPTPRTVVSSVSTSASPKLSSFDMAWRCSGSTNAELVKNMARAGLIESTPVMEAMMKVDRGFFLPEDEPALTAYQDSPQTIGYGATISAPHMHAMCLELLKDQLKPGATALDVGSGSGYLVAAMAAMVGKSTAKSVHSEGKQIEPASSVSSSSSSSTPSIFGIEHIKELVTLSHSNLDRYDKNWRSYISVVKGDGRQGIAGKQFDAIHVGAAAPELPPALIEQLKPHGRLVIPVGEDGGEQYLLCVDKQADGTIKKQTVSGVRYVPLTDESKQRKSAR